MVVGGSRVHLGPLELCLRFSRCARRATHATSTHATGGDTLMPHSTPIPARSYPASPSSARRHIRSTPLYTWTTLTPAQRQSALVLAGEGERHRRNVRRRTILLTS